MDYADFLKILADYIISKCGILYQFGGSKIDGFWKLYRRGEKWQADVDTSLDHLSKRNNTILYWYNLGVRDEELLRLYSTEKGWRPCKICGIIHRKIDGYRSCCSLPCYNESRRIGNIKLSASRQKYNNRDPVQYAARHNMALEEATDAVNSFVLGGSVRRPEYWIARGFSESEAKKKVSDIQSSCSPRCVEYWIARGFSESEARLAVGEHQSCMGKKSKIKYGSARQFSVRCVEYWIARGFSESEAKKKVSDIQSKSGKVSAQKYTIEERRAYNPRCIEYYLSRYTDIDVAYAELAKFYQSIKTTPFRSKIADGFCESLDSMFEWLESNRYFKEKEYTRYFSELKRVFRYDYVDTKLKVVVEFNGDYWHANPKKYSENDIISIPGGTKVTAKEIWNRDDMKLSSMIELGYRVYVVWESDYTNDPVGVLEELYKEILNED